MDYTEISKLVDKFLKFAQQQLNDASLKQVVVDYYNEAASAPPTDIRIEYPGASDVVIWSNSYLDAPHDSTLQDRLHQAFDPQRENYNFYVKFFE
jgi:hypothetical protein